MRSFTSPKSMTQLYLVDDQPMTHYISKKLFEIEQYSGIIKAYTNPIEAFNDLRKEKSALLLLDLQMPEMSGWEFLERMKMEKLSFQTFILSSSTSVLDKDKAENYPFVIDYLVKPLNITKVKNLMKVI